jgi:3-oxoacyl-[acyl-carrier-protein] synthase II
MKAWINGIGWTTPVGCGQGRNGQLQPLQAGELQIPQRKDVFAQINRRFGRLDDFSRVGLAAVAFTLRDAAAETWELKRPVGIVAASRYGCLQTDLEYHQTLVPQQGKLASPNLFAYTLPNCFLGEAALRFGLTGNSMIINRHDPTRLAAIKVGLEELAWSEQSGVLTGIIDLAPPPELAAEDDLPGSLFMLLGREPGIKIEPYGLLELAGEQLLFNGDGVANLTELITACLANNK